MNTYDQLFYDNLLRTIKNNCKNNRIKFPNNKNLLFLEEAANKIKLQLSAKAIGLDLTKPLNMQETDACFEGWALILKTYYHPQKLQLILDIADDIDTSTVPDFASIVQATPGSPLYEDARRQKYGHWGRFLYRALRFSQQYSPWFSLSDRLKQLTDAFAMFLQNNKAKLHNNLPKDEAASKGYIKDPQQLDENSIEDMLVKPEKLRKVLPQGLSIGTRSNRQLPVGLYHDSNAKIFTGRSSAIDLWNLGTNNSLNIIELKYNNKMVGIVTEIFFYVNYVHDFLAPNSLFTLTKYVANNKSKAARGYSKLQTLAKNGCTTINGIMLADYYHPLVNYELLAVMNNNSQNHIIHYYLECYDYHISINRPITHEK